MLPFIDRLGLLGAVQACGCHHGRPGSPPRLLCLPPARPFAPGADKSPCPGQGAALGAGGGLRLCLVWGLLAGVGARRSCGSGAAPGQSSRRASAWGRFSVGTHLQPSRAVLGLGRARCCLWGWGHLQDCGGACTGDRTIWAQGGLWGRDGLWGRAGAGKGIGSVQGWPGLGSGEARWPGCGEHPVELGAAPQGHGESPAEGCGDHAVGWGCVAPPGWVYLHRRSPGRLPKVSRGGWRGGARALTLLPGSQRLGWAQPLALGSCCAPTAPGIPCPPTAKLYGSIPLRCGAGGAQRVKRVHLCSLCPQDTRSVGFLRGEQGCCSGWTCSAPPLLPGWGLGSWEPGLWGPQH